MNIVRYYWTDTCEHGFFLYTLHVIQGLGRTACIGTVLGIVWGIHFVIWIQLLLYLCFGDIFFQSFHNNNEHQIQDDRELNPSTTATTTNYNINYTQRQQILFMLWQWCTYVICLCTFHLLEFFITAIYNPTQATSDSYLINHSITYTIAAIVSWIEFWIRFIGVVQDVPILHAFHLPQYISYIGVCILVMAQCIRSIAMATAGESFNHLIQTSKKQNHKLITNGIYRIFRHPSYVGFFYWSISTQLVLGNVIHVVLYTMASWTFFNRRIQYEEESLCQFFPDSYPQYVAQTYMGIPWIKSQQYYIASTADGEITSTSTDKEGSVTIKKVE
jgi:protein-S-isoprenylcysteine O-methyltransferase